MEKPVMPKETNPVRAIRGYCLSCCLEQASEVKMCAADECPLWEFRMGKNPYRAKPSEKKIEAARRAAAANFRRKTPEQNRDPETQDT